METLLHIGLSNAVVAAVLALGVLVLARAIRMPALIHSLWLLVLIKLVTPPLVTIPFSLPTNATGALAQAVDAPLAPAIEPLAATQAAAPSPQTAPVPELFLVATATQADVEGEMASTDVSEDIAPVSATWSLDNIPWSGQAAVAWTWLVCSTLWLGVVGFRVLRFQQHLRSAQPAPAWLQRQCDELAMRLGLRNGPPVWLLPGAVSPMLWAPATRPKLLVPTALWARLDDDQRRTLLLHELAHFRRGDHWVRGIELLATGLFWWFPVLWLARRHLRQAEEHCCDAWVVWALPGSARAYATALLETVDWLSEARPALPAVASGFGHAIFLKRRLTMILHETTPRALGWAGFVLVLGLSALLLPVQAGLARQDGPPAVQRPRGGDPRGGDEEQQRQEVESQRRADELQRARQAVEKMQAQMAQMRDQLREAEARFRQAQEQLERAMQQQDRQRRPNPVENPERSRREADSRPEPRQGQNRGEADRRPGQGGGRPENTPADRQGPRDGRGNPDQRLNELERKFEAILQELQSIRRDMRPREGGPAGRGGPGGPGRPGGPGGFMPGSPGPGGPPIQGGRSGGTLVAPPPGFGFGAPVPPPPPGGGAPVPPPPQPGTPAPPPPQPGTPVAPVPPETASGPVPPSPTRVGN